VKPPRVSTQRLLDFGYLKEGEVLYSKDKKYEVTLLNDGNVEYNGIIGSIHKISAIIKNKTNNNGWDYFYCIKNGTLISIDELRYLANNDKKI
jgi:site-specific DNA-methyltransferase (adenine-specific)